MRLPAVVVSAAALTLVPGVAAGEWVDTATVAGSTVTAAVVPAPALSCEGELVGVTFRWPAVSGATSYVFYLTDGSAGEVVTGTSRYVASLAGGGTATVVARRSFPGTTATWTSVRSNPVNWGSLVVSGCR